MPVASEVLALSLVIVRIALHIFWFLGVFFLLLSVKILLLLLEITHHIVGDVVLVTVLVLNSLLRQVHNLWLDGIVELPQLCITVRKVAPVAEQTILMLIEVAAALGLILVVDLVFILGIGDEAEAVNLRRHLAHHLIALRHHNVLREAQLLLVASIKLLVLHLQWLL